MSDDFTTKISKLVARHPELTWSLVINDSHIQARTVPSDLFNDIFCNVWVEYNQALFDAIVRMVRYQKSAMAWDKLISQIEDVSLQKTVMVDYAEPVYRALVDMPIMFKDEVIRGSVRLSLIHEDEGTALAKARKIRQGRWIDKFKTTVGNHPLGLQLVDLVTESFYDSKDAVRLREIHGNNLHDASSTFAYGKPFTEEVAAGVTIYGFENAWSFSSLLPTLDRQRRMMQHVYASFHEYAQSLYGEILQATSRKHEC